MLREYFKAYRPKHKENYLFISPQTGDKYTVSGPEIAFREIKKKAGITSKVTVHGLRHNFATDLIENGLDILHLQKLLGHSGIRSTMEYLYLSKFIKLSFIFFIILPTNYSYNEHVVHYTFFYS